jgi:hypothetical protein
MSMSMSMSVGGNVRLLSHPEQTRLFIMEKVTILILILILTLLLYMN